MDEYCVYKNINEVFFFLKLHVDDILLIENNIHLL
jgi:hypothetical protein